MLNKLFDLFKPKPNPIIEYWRDRAEAEWRAGHYRIIHCPDIRTMRFEGGEPFEVDFGTKTILKNQYGHPDAIAPACRIVFDDLGAVDLARSKDPMEGEMQWPESYLASFKPTQKLEPNMLPPLVKNKPTKPSTTPVL